MYSPLVSLGSVSLQEPRTASDDSDIILLGEHVVVVCIHTYINILYAFRLFCVPFGEVSFSSPLLDVNERRTNRYHY